MEILKSMPNTKSAKKMLRRDTKARARNRSQVKAIKTAVKKFRASLVTTPDMVETSFAYVQSLVDKAGRKNLMPRGRAKRLVSRLMHKKVEAIKSNPL